MKTLMSSLTYHYLYFAFENIFFYSWAFEKAVVFFILEDEKWIWNFNSCMIIWRLRSNLMFLWHPVLSILESFFLPHPATFLRAQEEEVCLEVEGFEGEVEFTMQFYSFNDRTSFYAEPTGWWTDLKKKNKLYFNAFFTFADVDAIKFTDFSQAKPDAEFKQKGGKENLI